MSDAIYPRKPEEPFHTSEPSSSSLRDEQRTRFANRVTEKAHGAVDRLAPAVEKLESGVVHAKETLRVQAERAREVGDQWVDNMRTEIRANPLRSVLLAMAAGAVLSRFMRHD